MKSRQANRNFIVIRRKDSKRMGRFRNRKEAVFWCKANQSFPLPDYEWEDEFEIQKLVYS